MSGSLTPDALPAVASFIATTELHICASHPADDAIWDRRPNPNWDFEIRQSQAFFGNLVLIMACRSLSRSHRTILQHGTFGCIPLSLI